MKLATFVKSGDSPQIGVLLDGEQTIAALAAGMRARSGESSPHFADMLADGKIILIRPKITAFRTLQFSLTNDQKWQAVMAGFVDGLPELANAGILEPDKLKAALEITREYQRILKRTTTGKNQKQGQLSEATEKLLVSQGLL